MQDIRTDLLQNLAQLPNRSHCSRDIFRDELTIMALTRIIEVGHTIGACSKPLFQWAQARQANDMFFIGLRREALNQHCKLAFSAATFQAGHKINNSNFVSHETGRHLATVNLMNSNLKDLLRQQINENPAWPVIRELLTAIQSAGHQAYLVGGGVRDMILGRPPKDHDIATSARPEDLQRLFPHSNLVGAKFGVILVSRRGISIEIATFREEGEYSDRRRPDLVKFSTIEADARRRDFTCNALYYDPLNDHLLDLVGGVKDISARCLRTVGLPGDRFHEDALRILRAIRFAANLDFEPEAETWKSVIASAPLLREISMERVRDELLRGFTGGHPARFLDLLEASGIMAMYLPELLQLKGCQQPPQFHPEGDVYNHVRVMLEHMPQSPSAELVLAVLLHDIAKPATQTFDDRIRFNGHDKLGAEMSVNIGRRLRLSNGQIEQVSDMVRRHMQFINVPSMRKSTLRKFLASPNIEDELELHRLDCLGSHGNLDTYDYVQTMQQQIHDEGLEKLPVPLLNGDHLIAAGLPPGPGFAHILRRVYDAQLEGDVQTLDQALALGLSMSSTAGNSFPPRKM